MSKRSRIDAIGAAVSEYRNACGMTQHQLAHQATIGVGTLRRMESGRSVSLETLMAVSDALGVRLSTLVSAADNGPNSMEIETQKIAKLEQLRHIIGELHGSMGSIEKIITKALE